ncbi:MAG: molybdenum cofactor guanylyltransferase MobA [Rhodanobacteraceae bacterium]
MEHTHHIAGLILAGGAGKRLGGRDKGLATVGGKPLIAWLVAAVRAQVDSVLIVANRHRDTYAQYAPAIGDELTGFRGPLAGIAAGLGAIDADWMLTVPVDCVEPPPDLARRLLDAAAAHATIAAVAHDGERRQPLFALYAAELVRSAACAATTDASVWHWQNEMGAVEVDCPTWQGKFSNLNTADEFAAFERELDGRS